MAHPLIRPRLWITVVGWWLLTGLAATAQDVAISRDRSEHRVRMVMVDANVQLEVLEWGGSGRPLVLLAGCSTPSLSNGRC